MTAISSERYGTVEDRHGRSLLETIVCWTLWEWQDVSTAAHRQHDPRTNNPILFQPLLLLTVDRLRQAGCPIAVDTTWRDPSTYPSLDLFRSTALDQAIQFAIEAGHIAKPDRVFPNYHLSDRGRAFVRAAAPLIEALDQVMLATNRSPTFSFRRDVSKRVFRSRDAKARSTGESWSDWASDSIEANIQSVVEEVFNHSIHQIRGRLLTLAASIIGRPQPDMNADFDSAYDVLLPDYETSSRKIAFAGYALSSQGAADDSAFREPDIFSVIVGLLLDRWNQRLEEIGAVGDPRYNNPIFLKPLLLFVFHRLATLGYPIHIYVNWRNPSVRPSLNLFDCPALDRTIARCLRRRWIEEPAGKKPNYTLSRRGYRMVRDAETLIEKTDWIAEQLAPFLSIGTIQPFQISGTRLLERDDKCMGMRDVRDVVDCTVDEVLPAQRSAKMEMHEIRATLLMVAEQAFADRSANPYWAFDSEYGSPERRKLKAPTAAAARFGGMP